MAKSKRKNQKSFIERACVYIYNLITWFFSPLGSRYYIGGENESDMIQVPQSVESIKLNKVNKVKALADGALKKGRYKDIHGKPFTEIQYQEYAIRRNLSPIKARWALEEYRKINREQRKKSVAKRRKAAPQTPKRRT